MKGIYRQRWQWWAPWQTTRWWLPSLQRSADEYCNPSILAVFPPLGALVVFWKPGKQRTAADGPCAECLAEEQRLIAEGWVAAR